MNRYPLTDTRKSVGKHQFRQYLHGEGEIPYYSNNADLGRKDIYSHCGGIDAQVNMELKKKFKTVLPICNDCLQNGKTAVVLRPIVSR